MEGIEFSMTLIVATSCNETFLAHKISFSLVITHNLCYNKLNEMVLRFSESDLKISRIFQMKFGLYQES